MEICNKLLPEDEFAKAMEQHRLYREGLGVWARPFVRTAARTMSAHGWWMQCGGAAPELQKVACKVLSQVSSACSCERNWSTYGFIHSKARNRLQPFRAEKLVAVHSNMRLVKKLKAVDYAELYPQYPSSDSEGESDGEAGSSDAEAWADEASIGEEEGWNEGDGDGGGNGDEEEEEEEDEDEDEDDE